MKSHPPNDWLAGETTELQTLLADGLAAARGEGLSEAQRARLLARLSTGPELDLGAGGSGSETLGTNGGSQTAGKWLWLVSIFGLVGALAWLETGRQSEGAPRVARLTSTVVTAQLEPANGQPPSAPNVSAEVPPPPPSPPARPAVRPRPNRTAAAANAHAQPAQVPSELALIRRAHRHLRVDPAAALEDLQAHLRLYPGGALGQERDVLRVEGLLRTGQRAQAEQLAAHFLARHPGSTHRQRVQTLLRRTRAKKDAP